MGEAQDCVGAFIEAACVPLDAGHASGTLPPTRQGSVMLGPNAQGNPWPLPPGRYVVHYLLTDQYHSAAGTRFSVSR